MDDLTSDLQRGEGPARSRDGRIGARLGRADERLPVTRAEDLRNRIAEEITTGHILPGARLDETQLAERFEVSRTPVREALKQLSAMGLVTRGARRTMTVAEISPGQLGRMFELMGELEATCARLAAANMTSEDRAAMERHHERCRARLRAGDAAGYGEANAAFHGCIYGGTHNEYVVEATQHIRARLAPFRKAQFYSPDRMVKSFEEHEMIVRPILRGDQVTAANAMREHIGAARAAYADFFARLRAGE